MIIKTREWILLLLAVLVSLLLIFHVQLLSWHVRSRSSTVLLQHQVEQSKPMKTDFDFSQVKPESARTLSRYVDKSKIRKLGMITIPALDMTLPIVEGVSPNALLIGAGTFSPTQKMGQGNYSLMGHNVHDGLTLFAPLERAKVGMLAYLNNGKHTYVYRVNKINMVAPTELSVLDSHKKRELTLVTCNANGQQRIIVHAQLQDKANETNAQRTITSALTKSRVVYQMVPTYSVYVLIILLVIVLLRFTNINRKEVN
jgi:sortase A